MVEVLDRLEQLAKERADALQRTSEALAAEPDGLLVVAKDSCNFVRLLTVIWSVMQLRFHKGGVPAKRLLQECHLLLDLSAGIGQRLALIDKVWRERSLPAEVAEPIYEEVKESEVLVKSLIEAVEKTRERAAAPPPISADPEELKSRIKQANKNGEWVKLSKAIGRWAY